MPFIVGLYVVIGSVKDGAPSYMLKHVTNILYAQGVQVLLIHFVIFISWKQGNWLWLKIAPKLYFGLLVGAYLAVPFVLLIYSHENWDAMRKDAYFLQIFVSLFI